jgi:hypothetical protein
MSPTVFRHGPYRFFFFSREEMRPHIHVSCADGEAKFWVSPKVTLAYSSGVSKVQLRQMADIIQEYRDEIRAAWKKHFDS